MEDSTRPIRAKPVRRIPRCRPVAIGLAIMPVVSAVAFCGMAVATQAMFGSNPIQLPNLDAALRQLWMVQVLTPTPTGTAAPTETPTFAFVPSATIALDTLSPSDTPDPFIPTETFTPTAMPTVTSTPTTTPTGTVTSTPTTTETNTPTVTNTWIPWPTWTRTPTRTRTWTPSITPTPTDTPTPTLTHTFGPSPTPSDTPTVTPTVPTATPTITSTVPTATPIGTCTLTSNSSFETTLLNLINTERQSRGLHAYALQGQLQTAARVHAADMACNGFGSHTGSDGSSVRDRVERQGYSWSWIGENYYNTGSTSSSTPQTVFNWWMNSTPHRNNLLSPNYTEIGIGYRRNPSTGYGSFVAVFARPG